MTGTFFARMDELAEAVGNGDLVGKLVVDQPYAAAQHEGAWKTGPLAGVRIRNHPGGGGGKYLESPLKEKHPAYLQALAAHALLGTLAVAMAGIAEDLAKEVSERAPVESGDLRKSGQPFVYDGGRLVNHRPPAAERKG